MQGTAPCSCLAEQAVLAAASSRALRPARAWQQRQAHHVAVGVPRLALDARQVRAVLLCAVVVKPVGCRDQLDAAGGGQAQAPARPSCLRQAPCKAIILSFKSHQLQGKHASLEPSSAAALPAKVAAHLQFVYKCVRHVGGGGPGSHCQVDPSSAQPLQDCWHIRVEPGGVPAAEHLAPEGPQGVVLWAGGRGGRDTGCRKPT